MPGDFGALGKAYVEVSADLDSMRKEFEKGRKQTQLFSDDTQKKLRNVGLAFTGVSVAAGSALAGMAIHAVKAGDEFDKMSKRTGVSVENLSALSYAAEISGTNITTVENGLRFLSRAMDDTSKGTGESIETFEKLDIAVQNTDGSLRPTVEVLKEAADKIAAMTNETEQVAAATDIFGSRYGTQMLPLLKEGSDGIEKLTGRAEKLGLVLSTEAASAAAEFNDRMTDLKSSVSMTATQIGSALLPTLQPLIERATEVVSKFNQWDPATKRLITSSGLLVTGLTGIIGAGTLMASQLPKVIEGFGTLKSTLVGLPASLSTVAAGGLAVGSSIWAIHENIQAFRDSADVYRGQLRGLEKVSKDQVDIIEKVRSALERLSSKGIDPASVSMGDLGLDLGKVSDKLGVIVSPTRSAHEMLGHLEKSLGASAEEAQNLRDKIAGDKGLTQAQTDAVESAADLVSSIKESTTEWDALSEKVKEWTDITGEGYKASTLDMLSFYKNAKDAGLESVEAQRGITNTINDLRQEYFDVGADVQKALTVVTKGETDKRETIHRDYISKDMESSQVVREAHKKLLGEETGMIKAHYDHNVQMAFERSRELIQARADQFYKEHQLFMGSLDWQADFWERSKNLQDEEERHLLEIQNRKFKILQEETRERDTAFSALMDFAEKEAKKQLEVTESYSEKAAIIEEIYDKMSVTYQHYGEDMTGLTEWREGQLRNIEEASRKAREKEEKSHRRNLISEVESYYDVVTQHERLFPKAYGGLWGGMSINQPMAEAMGGEAAAYQYRAWESSGLAGYNKLQQALALVKGEAKDMPESFGRMAKEEEKLTRNTILLSDELAGHSLTTAFESVAVSMRGFAEGLADNATELTGFAQLTEEYNRRFVNLEEEKSRQMNAVLMEYLNGKIESEGTAFKRMEELQIQYNLRARQLDEERIAQRQAAVDRMARIEPLLWRMEQGGYVSGYDVLGMRERIQTAGGFETQYGQPAASRSLTVNVNIENMYGGSEAERNKFAEDVARRIVGLNISL